MRYTHWGNWIHARAQVCGISTQKDLSEAVGVSRKVVSGWYRSEARPRLRDSSVRELAISLNTHPDIIKHGYVQTDPAEAPTENDYWDLTIEKNAEAEILRLAVEAGYTELISIVSANLMRDQIRNYITELNPENLREIWKRSQILYGQQVNNRMMSAGGMWDDNLSQAISQATRLYNEMIQDQLKAVRKKISDKLGNK